MRYNLPRVELFHDCLVVALDSIMFMIHNLTNKTIVLSDLRAEIGPRKIVDLERIIERDRIDKSGDLRIALKTKRLILGKHSVIRFNKTAKTEVKVIERTIEKTIEKHNTIEKMDEDSLLAKMKLMLEEHSSKKQDVDIEDKIERAMRTNAQELIGSIRDQINSIQITAAPQESDINDLPIDPAQFAELASRAIEKTSEELEVNTVKKNKSIKIKNTRNLDDLASELD